jgi:hypothetical protein
VWTAFAVVAAWSLGVLLLALTGQAIAVVSAVRNGRDPATSLLTVFALGSIGLFVIILLTTPTFFDRYIFMSVAAIAGAALLFAQREALTISPRAAPASVLALAAFVLVALAFVDATSSVDGARWTLGEKAVAMGVDPSFVDAGWEWYAFHGEEVVTSPTFGGDAPWVRWFHGHVCRRVTTFEPTRQVLDQSTVRSPLLGSMTLYLIAGPESCTPN